MLKNNYLSMDFMVSVLFYNISIQKRIKDKKNKNIKVRKEMVEFVENAYIIKVPSNSPAEDYANLTHALLEYMKIAEKNTEEERYWIGNLLQAMQLDDSQVRKVSGEESGC